MGINSQDLDILIRLREEGYIPNQASIIEIGAQQISNSFLSASSQLDELAKLFGVTTPHRFPKPVAGNIVHGALEHLNAEALAAREFWKWLGFHYASIDIDGSPGSIPLDLNFDPTPKDSFGQYHLVTNFGTTEHVANQLNAFKVIHELTSLGGVMVHNLPAQGMMNHGLINYNPKFFWMLARSNGYKWLYADYTSANSYYELPQNIIDNVIPFNPNITDRAKTYQVADGAVVVAMQKVFDSPFVPPLDVPTGLKTDNKMLEERYWSVFKRDAFSPYVSIEPARPIRAFLKKVASKILP